MQRVLIVLKTEIKIRDMNKLVNFLSDFNNLKRKVDEIDIDKLKILPLDLKNLSNVVSREVLEKTLYNKVNLKVNNSESRNVDASTLIQINQYNIDKQKLERKNGNVNKKKV